MPKQEFNEFQEKMQKFRIVQLLNITIHILCQYEEEKTEKPANIWDLFAGSNGCFTIDKNFDLLGEHKAEATSTFENIMSGMVIPNVDYVVSITGAHGIKKDTSLSMKEVERLVNKHGSYVGGRFSEVVASDGRNKLLVNNSEKVLHTTFIDSSGAFGALIIRESQFRLLDKLRNLETAKDRQAIDVNTSGYEKMFKMFCELFHNSDVLVTKAYTDNMCHDEMHMLKGIVPNGAVVDEMPHFNNGMFLKELPKAVAALAGMASLAGIDISNWEELNEEDMERFKVFVSDNGEVFSSAMSGMKTIE